MSDRIVLKGNSKLLMPVITQIMGIYQLLEQKDIGIIYADASASPPVRRRGRPKIVLYFIQDTNFKPTGTRSTTPHGRNRQQGYISFRLMNETAQSFTEANQKAIGLKIKEKFGANGGYVWEKGKNLYSYTDWDMGYQFELLCRSAAKAKLIITDVLSIQNHTPNWVNLNHVEADQPSTKYPILPPKKIIAGKERQAFEQRPVVDVRFQYAYATVEGLDIPIDLYDRTKKRLNPMVPQ